MEALQTEPTKRHSAIAVPSIKYIMKIERNLSPGVVVGRNEDHGKYIEVWDDAD